MVKKQKHYQLFSGKYGQHIETNKTQEKYIQTIKNIVNRDSRDEINYRLRKQITDESIKQYKNSNKHLETIDEYSFDEQSCNHPNLVSHKQNRSVSLDPISKNNKLRCEVPQKQNILNAEWIRQRQYIPLMEKLKSDETTYEIKNLQSNEHSLTIDLSYNDYQQGDGYSNFEINYNHATQQNFDGKNQYPCKVRTLKQKQNKIIFPEIGQYQNEQLFKSVDKKPRNIYNSMHEPRFLQNQNTYLNLEYEVSKPDIKKQYTISQTGHPFNYIKEIKKYQEIEKPFQKLDKNYNHDKILQKVIKNIDDTQSIKQYENKIRKQNPIRSPKINIIDFDFAGKFKSLFEQQFQIQQKLNEYGEKIKNI